MKNHLLPIVAVFCGLLCIAGAAAEKEADVPDETSTFVIDLPSEEAWDEALASRTEGLWQCDSDDMLLTQLRRYSSIGYWRPNSAPPPTRDVLVLSLQAARKYYLAQQKPEGNFIYSIDLETGEISNDDNQVRQAGALWGLVRLHQVFPTPETRQAILKGLGFVSRNMVDLPCGKTCFVYPGSVKIDTGTVALYCLSLVDFRNDAGLTEADRKLCDDLLDDLLEYLRFMESDRGYWYKRYLLDEDRIVKAGSPYYDGEALLAYCKAARFAGKTNLVERIDYALPRLVNYYILANWGNPAYEKQLKGFYQWSTMACDQYISAGWGVHDELAARTAFMMAYWQIFQNDLQNKNGNVGYAVEGLAAAVHIADKVGNQHARAFIVPAIHNIMMKLLSMQYMGPYSRYNGLLVQLEGKAPASAEGGITSGLNKTDVRIDTVQHQVHAMLLLLEYLY